MKYLIALGVIILLVAVVVVIMAEVRQGLAQGRREAAARRVRDDRDAARWRTDDTVITDDGLAQMRIELAAPDVTQSYGTRDVGEPYEPGDLVTWAERRGQADALVRELNDLIDLSQRQRRDRPRR